METFNLPILFRTIRGIVPVLNSVLFHKSFHDIGNEFFPLISTNFLNSKWCSRQDLFKKVSSIYCVGCLIAPSKYPSSGIINDGVDDLSLFVTKRIFGIHLKL